MADDENMDFVRSEDISRWAPTDQPNVSIVNMSGRAADKLAQRLGMVVDGKPVRLRAAWIEFFYVPAFVHKNWHTKGEGPTAYPILVDVSESGLIFAHDPSGNLVWRPEDAKAAGDWDMTQDWRWTLVPWSNIASITGDLDCGHYRSSTA